MNADECRYETERHVERRREQRTERHERCRSRPWWHPERWFCEIVNVVVDVIVEVETVTRRLICTAAEAIEEFSDLAVRIGRWVGDMGDHMLGMLGGNFTGYWPIERTERRPVPSRPALVARGRSLSLGMAGPRAEEPYNHDGTAYVARIVDGEVHFAAGGAAESLWEPDEDDFPPVAKNRRRPRGAAAVSYDEQRIGDFSTAPAFDMIAAGGDRLIAKAAESDDLYIAVLAKPYRHADADDRSIDLPQSFFKLDPECGVPAANPDHLLAHVRVPGDDEHHAATERFPIFREAFTRSLDVMVVWFAPRIWHRVDARPRKDSFRPPRRYPTYGHITYRTNNPLRRNRTLRSIRYERVLDLGVGVSHLHEQHDPRFGGEADALSGQGGVFGRLLELPREMVIGAKEFEAAYRLANGPIEDYGGWVDGTCIYFMLAQLKSDERIAAGEWRQAYAILWIDEQMSFTERWRVLHPFDRDFTALFQPILGVISRTEEEFYPDAPFAPDRFWCPLLEGHVRPDSRMAVSRQFVALTGIDPDTGDDEIYTIHFSWPTMDKTWRRRSLPTARPEGAKVACDPTTLQLRDDATLLVSGRRQTGDRMIDGYFHQRILPADGQEAPSVARLSTGSPFAPPPGSYTHPWHFVAREAGDAAAAMFSHFGVHEPVDSRVQYYEIGFDLPDGETVAAIEATTWLDVGSRLRLEHDRIDCTEAAAAIRSSSWPTTDIGRFVDALFSTRQARTHASSYHDPMRFRLRFRGDLGWILLHADRRDDKLIGFTNLPLKHCRLVAADDPGRSISLSVGAHRRNEQDRHGRTVGEEADALSPPAVREARVAARLGHRNQSAELRIELDLARGPDAAHPYSDYAAWVASNLWRVNIAAVDPAGRAVVPIATVDRPDMRLFGQTLSAGMNLIAAPFPLEELLSEAGRMTMFTSLWCVGPTGLAACPDATSWSVTQG